MIRIISDLKEMKQIRYEWNELARPFKNPLFNYEWFASCAESLSRSDQIQIIISFCHGEIAGIAPLVLTKKKFGVERLEILGMRVLGEPTGIVYKDVSSLQRLIDGIIQVRRPLHFARLPYPSPETVLLKSYFKGKCVLVNHDMGSPFLEVNKTWEHFVSDMRPGDRNHIRRKQKQIEAEGEVRYQIISPSPDSIEEYLKEFFSVEMSGWKGRFGTALLLDDCLKSFFLRYTKETARQGSLRMGFLRVNNKAIAAIIAVVDSNRFWLLKIGFDEAWAKYSPGILLTHETIRYAFETECEGYEFLGQNEKWIHRWARRTHPYVTVRGYPYSYRGIECFAKDVFSSIMKKITKMKCVARGENFIN